MDGVVDQTRQILFNELPAGEYKVHADRITSASPALFEFYRIKPFYILLVLVLHKVGFSYTHASAIPSLLCYLLIGLSIWRFSIQRLRADKTFIVSLICILIYPTLLLARLSTPDALSCFILLNAFLLIYFGRNKTLWLCLFLLAIFTRIDNLVSELIFLFALWRWPVASFRNKLNAREFIVFSALLIAMAFLVNLTTTHHFLWFRDEYFVKPAGHYLNDVINYFFVFPGSFLMCLLLVFIFTGLFGGFSWKIEENYVFYTICAVVLVRFLLYPYYEERYFAAFILFSLMTMAFKMEELKKLNR